ncbi:MAG: ATP-dependent zinc metalloprotease FtsH [Desulfobulbaceae bacterium]|nr:ATP-dependent zinc metalloprotease FtsH [Desulfobulbaceae bacterium]
MKKTPKFSFWYIAVALWAVLIIQNFIISSYSLKSIPYSTFIEYVKQGKIEEISISDTYIQGTMKGDDEKGQKIQFQTIRVDEDISQLLSENHVQFTGIIENTFLRDLLSWIILAMIFVAVWLLFMRKLSSQQPGFMSLGKNKAKIYKQQSMGITFKDVAGVDEAKAELEEVIEFLRTPDKYLEFGGKMPKGILLVGLPGTGKTMLAKAVAGESDVPFYCISGSEFVEMFVGLGAARVRDLFEEAKKNAPCIIFIDELDALGKARGVGGPGGHDEREQTLNQLLVELDGFDTTIGVILMAATNRPEVLDPALLRPGRFDRQVLVDRPDKIGRKKILEVHLKNINRIDEDLDIDSLASMTAGMVGADLANLVNEAALLTVRKGKKTIAMAMFEEAVERIVAGLEKKNRVIIPKEREIVAYHELGHALVAMSIPGSDPIQKITIVPRGIAALGYTMQVPTEDRFLMSKTELLNKIAMLLGGRAAEEIVFNDISTGAHNDLSKATDIARSMIIEYGMNEKLGQVYLKGESRPQFLVMGGTGGTSVECSDQTARIIDEEIKKIIDSQYKIATSVLKDKANILKIAAKELLEKEKIDSSYLTELINNHNKSNIKE